MKIFKLCLIFLFLGNLNSHHFEKFFEINGGPEQMYYYTEFEVGSDRKKQSAIIDTGSDTLAFPCNDCKSGNCGSHENSRFTTKTSNSFKFQLHCPYKILYKNRRVCQFVKRYAEGSSLHGFLANDYVKFKDAKRVRDNKLNQFNQKLKVDLRLKAQFGCTTKETGLFKDQYADGILGLDDGSSLISSMEQDNTLKGEKVFSFGLCFHKTGGIMSIDLRHKFHKDDKITMLDNHINHNQTPIVVEYITENNYYELVVDGMELAGKKFNTGPISMMIDSGTTFSHFPTDYMKNILFYLNKYCSKYRNLCGRIPNVNFKEDSCVELQQPDTHYKDVNDLLNSFPPLKIHLQGISRPYILYPKNYFYEEYLSPEEQRSNLVRLCFALKAEGEEDKIILGAFSMIDYYFYFDRKDHQIKIFKEDCYLRTNQLLKMRRARILEVVSNLHETIKINYQSIIIGLSMISLIGLGLYKKKKAKTNQIKIFNFIQKKDKNLKIQLSQIINKIVELFCSRKKFQIMNP